MSRELEVHGFAWGRNRSFGSAQLAARFRIDHIIRNDALPSLTARTLTEVSIDGANALPSYSPFIMYHVILDLQRPDDANVTNTGVRLFVVKRIKRCWTRMVSQKTLCEFLTSVYDNAVGDGAATMHYVDDYGSAQTKSSDTSKRWFREYVKPLLDECWPDDGLLKDNREHTLQHLRTLCTRLLDEHCMQQHLPVGNKRKRTSDAKGLRAAAVYGIVDKVVKACARGDTFEALLCMFPESMLLQLNDNQQRELLDLAYRNPNAMLFWPRAVDLLLDTPAFSNGDQQRLRLTLLGRRVHYDDCGTRLIHTNAMTFDGSMPGWCWMTYLQVKKSLAEADTERSALVSHETFQVYVNLVRYFHYNYNNSAFPENGRRSKYLEQIILNNSAHVRALVEYGALKTCVGNPSMVQLTCTYDHEMTFAQTLNRTADRLVFVDAEPCCSEMFLRQWHAGTVWTPTATQPEPLNSSSVRIYACNRQYATVGSAILGCRVFDIFADITYADHGMLIPHNSTDTLESNDASNIPTTAQANLRSIRTIYIWMAHKIPLTVLSYLLYRFQRRSATRLPLTVVFLGDGSDYVNANYVTDAFLRMSELGNAVVTQSNSKITYVSWRATPGRGSQTAQAYINARDERQHALEKKHGSLTTLFNYVRELETAQRRSQYVQTYAILCSNQVAKNDIHQRMAGAANRFHHDMFRVKQPVFVDAFNARGVIESVAHIRGRLPVVLDGVAGAELDCRHGVYELVVDGRTVRTDSVRINHTTVETVAHYVGVPVHTLIMFVTQKTTMRDICVAARYARERFVLYYSFETSYDTIVRYNFPTDTDVEHKIVQTLTQDQ